MDPQLRLMLEVSYEAIVDGGKEEGEEEEEEEEEEETGLHPEATVGRC